jgi:hypothetical protein
MGTLCAGKGCRLDGQACRSGRPDLDLDALIAQELDTGASVDSTTPVTPEKWRIPHSQRMQQNTDLARLLGGLALPLALLAQRTRTTPADAGSIHHAQAAIGFSTLLMDTKLLVCWTAKGSVWLEREIVA